MARDSNVVAMPQDAADEPLVPAIDMSIIQTLPGDRQIQVKTCILQAASQDEINGLMDRIFRAGDRQKARYELEAIEDDIVKNRERIEQQKVAIEIAESDHVKKLAETDAGIGTLKMDQSQLYDKALKEFRGKGREGSYEPKGATKQMLDRYADQIVKMEKAKLDADEVKRTALQNSEITIKHCNEMIEKLTKDAERLRSKIG